MNTLQDDDEHLRHLVTMSELHDVNIHSASLGLGFSSLLQGCGSRLSQLALSLQVFTSDNMRSISEECRNLKILHLFFTSFIQSSHDEFLYFSPKLEGQTITPESWPFFTIYFNLPKVCSSESCKNAMLTEFTSVWRQTFWYKSGFRNNVKCVHLNHCSPPVPAWDHCFCRGCLLSSTMSF